MCVCVLLCAGSTNRLTNARALLLLHLGGGRCIKGVRDDIAPVDRTLNLVYRLLVLEMVGFLLRWYRFM